MALGGPPRCPIEHGEYVNFRAAGRGLSPALDHLNRHGTLIEVRLVPSFEDVSTADSGGSPDTFVDVDGQLRPSTTMAGSATIKFQFCANTTDLIACKEAPMSSSANDTCSKTGP